MTMLNLQSIGCCAHYSPQGDWAFDFALRLAREHGLRLNVFHFLRDPYDPSDHTGEGLPRKELTRLVVERERELRFYYDDKLGDYVDVGFRLCEDSEWIELHRCLCRHEFELLVLAYTSVGASFAGKKLEAFAHSFVCPVVLVGPESPEELRLNNPAHLMRSALGILPGGGSLVKAED